MTSFTFLKYFLLFQFIVLYKSFIILPFTKKPPSSFDDVTYPKLITQMSFGSPPQSFQMCINTASPFTWLINGNEIQNKSILINHTIFNTSSSYSLRHTSNQTIFFYEDQIVLGEKYSDTIRFNKENTIEALEFFLAYTFRDILNCDGILGFQYNKLRFQYYTLNYQLSQKGLIESNQFSLEYINESTEGRVILGNDNISLTSIQKLNKSKKNLQCNVIKDELIAMWYCRIKQMILLPYHKKISKDAIISINPSFGLIIGPYTFKSVIINHILDAYIENGDCFEESYSYNTVQYRFDDYYKNELFYLYVCKKEANVRLDKEFKLSFYFDIKDDTSNHLDINKDDMFIDYNSTHQVFTILINSSIYAMKLASWVIGQHFLSKYKLIFNNDESIIQFIIQNNNSLLSLSNRKRQAMMVISIILLICLILFVSMWYSQRNALRQKKALHNINTVENY